MIEHGSPAWKTMKQWAEKEREAAQVQVNAKSTTDDETKYQRGRRDLADELWHLLEPRKEPPPPEPRPRDKTGY